MTATLEPSDTPTLPAPTDEVLQPDPTEQAYNAQSTKVAEFPATCKLETGENFISPDGNWMATECSAHKKGYNLEIVNKEGKHWTVQARNYGSGSLNSLSGLSPEHWSKDGEYLYFASYAGGSGGGYTCFYDFGADGLYRIRLNDGTVSPVLPAGNDFAFSPTRRRLAYGLGNLIIRDLQTGAEASINTGDSVFGPFFWSPDGSELVYATCESDNNDALKKSAVKIFSIRQDASRTILEVGNTHLTVAGWDANNIIKVYSEYEDLFFDMKSGQWMITPTPTP
jgi:Tol biopolymer transport system component